MSGSAADLIVEARRHLGYTESPPGSNRTKFGAWYGMDGQPWCAMFVSYCAAKAEALGVGKFAYTPTFAAAFRASGRFGTRPRVGAIAFFDFPDSVDRIQHVGIVESVNDDGSVTTIEGNTSPGDGGSQSNGGGVYRRVRRGPSIVGYGYPMFQEVVVVPFYYVMALFGSQSEATAFDVWCATQKIACTPSGAAVVCHGTDEKSKAAEAQAERMGGVVPFGRLVTMRESYARMHARTPYVPTKDTSERLKVVEAALNTAHAVLSEVKL